MSLKPSFYNHYTPTGDPAKAVLFNKFWGSVAFVDGQTASLLEAGRVSEPTSTGLPSWPAAGF